jgi:hypothetical protein
MEAHGSGEAIAALTEVTAIQAEIAHQRMALAQGHMVFTQLLGVWSHIEDHEMLAYGDKVGAQVGVLQQASTTLWHLQPELARTCHLLNALSLTSRLNPTTLAPTIFELRRCAA